ncbi:uncharacterized protein LOC133036597 [Cannabis sativa]|uniref:uncharacterized protein LOC133036597 n=1 Tax=Cannabis sativa TaxID=3483 RepID=UPI0029CA5A42|nr:uncharacterized protein LOC133036597 [Cannabis sativa]
MSLFPNARLVNIVFSTSDHCLLFLDPSFRFQANSRRVFRFENDWLRDPKCYAIIQEHWEACVSGNIVDKVGAIQGPLGGWERSLTNNFKERIQSCKTRIDLLKGRLDVESLSEYKEARKHLAEIYHQKEIFWRQRSKQLWLREGDQNTRYFHAAASSRRKNNFIQALKDETGSWVQWGSGLSQVMVDYYTNIFHSRGSNYAEVLDVIQPSIIYEDNVALLQPVLEEEVRHAVFQMHPDKSPEPDGLTPAFYQKCWHIVGTDVVKMVQGFFRSKVMPRGLNDTNLVLIPKKKSPSIMGDLRPIALCNASYKIISKVMANRLKHLLSKIISEFQSAFIPGRLITDNVIVSFEILHYLRHKQQGKNGCMTLKLDMSKAYDRMEWSFLRAILLRMGFAEAWVDMIMECLRTILYNIVHGGESLGPIIPSRGIRQGDPLSSYLFIICAEGLSALIRLYEEREWLHGCRVARGAPCENREEAQRVLELLNTFERASGQKVNLSKSSVFFSSNTDAGTRDFILSTLHTRAADDHSLYLGLPSRVGRNKNVTFRFLKEKVRKRIHKWDSKLLSRAGKEVLLKSVIQSLPTYAMSVFLILLEICKDVDQLMGRYWSHTKSSQGQGIHWRSCDKLCLHKHQGGFGFRNIRDFNLAMLGKQGWRLLTNNSSLVARVFKARYYSQSSFLDAELGANPSYVWRSVLGANLWLRWVRDGVLEPVFLYRFSINLGFLVRNIRMLPLLMWLFMTRDIALIRCIPLSLSSVEDAWFWVLETHGDYSVKSTYRALQVSNGRWNTQDNSGFWRMFWNLKLPHKVKNFLWRGLTCLPTLVALRSKRVHVSSLCLLCNREDETVFHIMVSCTFTKSCLDKVLGGSVGRGEAVVFGSWFDNVCKVQPMDRIERLAMLLWGVWRARNDLVWNNKALSVERVVNAAITYLDSWKNAQLENRVVSPISGPITFGCEQWAKPCFGEIKVNCDAAVFEDDNSFGLGWIAWDHNSLFIDALAVKTYGEPDPFLAEVIPLKEALSWVKGRWVEGGVPTSVVMESDSLLLVQVVQRKKLLLSPVGLLVSDCVALMQSSLLFPISISFVKRSGNQAANFLSRSSGSIPGCVSRGGFVPAGLEAILVADLI